MPDYTITFVSLSREVWPEGQDTGLMEDLTALAAKLATVSASATISQRCLVTPSSDEREVESLSERARAGGFRAEQVCVSAASGQQSWFSCLIADQGENNPAEILVAAACAYGHPLLTEARYSASVSTQHFRLHFPRHNPFEVRKPGSHRVTVETVGED